MDSNDRSIVGLAMVSHALVHTYELTIPLLMVAWLGEFPVTEATLGFVVAVGYGLFGFGALPSGVLSDRFGSQRLIAVCLFGMGASFALLSVASNLAVIAVAVCLWGAAASVYHPSGLSLISKGVKDTGSGFAYHGMAGNAGIALGPLAVVLLLVFVDWRAAALVLAVPAFLAVAGILRVDIDEAAAVNVSPDGGGSRSAGVSTFGEFVGVSRSLFLGGFAFVFAIIIFNGLYYRGILTFLPELLSDFTASAVASNVGVLSERLNPSDFIYIGLLMVGIAGQYVGGRAVDHVPVEKGLLAGYVTLAAIALLFIPVSGMGVTALVAVSLVLGFVLFSLQPLYQYAVSEYSPPDARGLSYGYTYLGQFGVGAAGAAVVGFILTYSTVSVVFATVAAFALVAAAIAGYVHWQ
jgi:MFS family permease